MRVQHNSDCFVAPSVERFDAFGIRVEFSQLSVAMAQTVTRVLLTIDEAKELAQALTDAINTEVRP